MANLIFGSTTITDVYHQLGQNPAAADTRLITFPHTKGVLIRSYGTEQTRRTARTFSFGPGSAQQPCYIHASTASGVRAVISALQNYTRYPGMMIQTLQFDGLSYSNMRMTFQPIGEIAKFEGGDYYQLFQATFVRSK